MNSKIVIPVYKSSLSADELQSLRQALRILAKYPFVFVTHDNVDVSIYRNECENSNVGFAFEFFNEDYFGSVADYSRLLLSREFYKRFSKDEYILIYQLDAFVFRDELEYWICLEFDYIGAPWFTHYGNHENGDKLWKVGNGGVSLRKISSFLSTFDKALPLSSYPFFVKNIRSKGFLKMLGKTICMLFQLVFTKHSVEYYINNYFDFRINEDCFWVDALSNTSIALKVPDALTAARFCIEQSPSYLYAKTSNNLPFSCHAYKRYEYDTFWKKYIDNNSFKS